MATFVEVLFAGALMANHPRVVTSKLLCNYISSKQSNTTTKIKNDPDIPRKILTVK
jgi:hypothetical protein